MTLRRLAPGPLTDGLFNAEKLGGKAEALQRDGERGHVQIFAAVLVLAAVDQAELNGLFQFQQIRTRPARLGGERRDGRAGRRAGIAWLCRRRQFGFTVRFFLGCCRSLFAVSGSCILLGFRLLRCFGRFSPVLLVPQGHQIQVTRAANRGYAALAWFLRMR